MAANCGSGCARLVRKNRSCVNDTIGYFLFRRLILGRIISRLKVRGVLAHVHPCIARSSWREIVGAGRTRTAVAGSCATLSTSVACIHKIKQVC